MSPTTGLDRKRSNISDIWWEDFQVPILEVLARGEKVGVGNAPCRKGEKDVENCFSVTDHLPFVFLRASKAIVIKYIKNNTVFD